VRGLRRVKSVVVPKSLATAAQAHCADVGQRGEEGIALWAGTIDGEIFRVNQTVIPAQSALRAGGGICAVVDGAELHRINVWLYENGLRLVAQLHSHPSEAYHSDTDDAYPIVTAVGGVSIVIPDFGRGPFSLDRCAVYRLTAGAGWVELAPRQAAALITFIEG
jgi:hypothetical protein